MDKLVNEATPSSADQVENLLARAALDYHEYPTPGKIAVTPTKSMSNQRELALARPARERRLLRVHDLPNAAGRRMVGASVRGAPAPRPRKVRRWRAARRGRAPAR